jgi:tungstate transport system substrate-binding protein
MATFLTSKDRLDLELLYQGDPVLRNEYSVMVVRNARNAQGAELFATWITSPETQRLIERFGRSAFGRSLFVGDAQ